MGRHSQLINRIGAGLTVFVLSGTMAYAVENYKMTGEDPAVTPTAKQQITYSPTQSEVVKAFTRELAFINTFAVSTPAQFEQKKEGEGTMGRGMLRSTGGPISEEQIKPPELRSTQLKDKETKKTKKGRTGRKK